ncbi:hypothetical protein M406DRAFT_325415 [Cryphonectria parasitica EP155]|uniref:Uncharacterized protein n=1 Tax=Cryphonectria parasitica (strain ATCC 38755 / EP155) TaxID=660469 RepID=A0A9P4YAS8_CRYP1|nr:uncharacterized protein M406DRAFT_325415 [Cryphonectria parasitica EP155]KAF3769933.1 hypothetical protein M406DRAFT_325415 [Cryphonectria parasitica EP155]
MTWWFLSTEWPSPSNSKLQFFFHAGRRVPCLYRLRHKKNHTKKPCIEAILSPTTPGPILTRAQGGFPTQLTHWDNPAADEADQRVLDILGRVTGCSGPLWVKE